MSDRAWISNIMSDARIGNKQGIRDKYYGENWEPARHEVGHLKESIISSMDRHIAGCPLKREEFPESSAVFDYSCFKKIGDLFIVGRFYAVKGQLAKILSSANLGDGGLIPYTIYEDDLRTPLAENFYILNFGCRKDSFISNLSRSIVPLAPPSSSPGLWSVMPWVDDKEIVLSPEALTGPDLWFEVQVARKIFISDALRSELMASKVKVDLRLKECRIMECG